ITLFSFLATLQRPNIRLSIVGLIGGTALVISHPILTIFVLWTLLCLGVVRGLRSCRSASRWRLLGTVLLLLVVMMTYWTYLTTVANFSVTVLYKIASSGSSYFPARPYLPPNLEIRIWGDLPWIALILGAGYTALSWIVRESRNSFQFGWAVMTGGV